MQTRTEKPLSPESYAKVVFTSEQLRLAHYHCMVNYIVYYIASRVEVRDSSKLRFPSWIPLGYHSHIKKSSPKLEVFWWAHQHGIANAGSNRFLYAGLLSGRRLSLLDARLVVGGWVWDGGVLRFWGIRYECLGSQRYIESEKSTNWYYVEPERSNDGSDLGADWTV